MPTGGARRLARLALAATMLASLLLTAFQPLTARAANITVTTTNDENNGSLGGGAGISLREAVLYAASGDVISLPAGTYALTIPGSDDLGRRGDLDLVGKSLTITGAGPGETRIVANFPNTSSSARDRVFHILGGATLSISGVTINGGITSTFGGGIRNEGTLNATNIVVRNNFAVVVENNRVLGSNGGGIANLSGARATISESEISGNTANRSGGGIFNAANATVTLDRVTVANNVTTREDGGGIANEGTLSVANSTFSGNSANRNGGGIYNNGSATVSNATITNNVANADRRIGGNGGGAYNDSATVGALTFRNSIIAGNIDRSAAELPPGSFQAIFPDLNARVQNTIVGNSNNLISSRSGITNSSTVGTPDQGDIVNATIRLGALGDNGGRTSTHLPAPNSPAVDAAKPADCAAAPVSNRDQRNAPRPADGNGDNTAVCDIGAVEIRAVATVRDGDAPLASGGTLAFGSTPRGTAITRTVTIVNSGEARLRLGAPTLSGDFAIATGFSSTSLDPGESTTLAIQLNATAVGAANGQLSFATNAPDAAQFQLTLSGDVTPQPARLVLSEAGTELQAGALLAFGGTDPAERTLTIRNAGDQPLNLGAITLPDGFEITQQPTSPVAAGATTTFTVGLTATEAGTYGGTLAIPSDDPASPFQVILSGIVAGTPGAPEITVVDASTGSPIADNTGAVNIGTTVVGTSLLRTFRISNIGDQPLTVGTVSVPSGFTVTRQPTSPIAPGASTNLTVQANATAAGSFSGLLSFANNDADENPFNFAISATVSAQPARIEVREGNTPIADNTGSVNFGTTTIGTPLVRTFTVRNTGGTALSLGTPSLPAGFSLVSPLATSVAAGATATFQVRLNAAAAGTFAGQISFSTNDSAANPFNFTVVGRVNQLPPRIALSSGTTTITAADSVNLGSTTLGTPIRRTFTIRNTGSSTLQIDSINVPPGYARNPAVVTADTLAPGATTTFELVLDADQTGTFDGEVTIRTNDPAQPDFAFTVRGTVNPHRLYLPMLFR